MEGRLWFEVRLFPSLLEELKAQVEGLWDKEWGTGSGKTPQQLAEDRDQFCSTPFAYILALEGDSVIGVVALHKREITYQGAEIVLGGFGGVYTVEEKRRKGVATTLLKQGMQELRSRGCDIAYLCTDIENQWLVEFYGYFGFVLLGRSCVYLGKSGRRYIEENGLIAPVESQDKFDLVLKGEEILDLGVGNW